MRRKLCEPKSEKGSPVELKRGTKAWDDSSKMKRLIILKIKFKKDEKMILTLLNTYTQIVAS